MVFGWGKKKLDQNEINVAPKEKHIILSDIADILEEIHSVRTKTIMAEVKTFRNKINSNCETLLKITKELDADTLNTEEIDHHLRRLVDRGKNDVLSIIKKECTKNLIEINSFDDVKVFSETVTKMLKRIGDSLGRQSNVIHIFAKKYAKRLKDDLRVMQNDNKEITELVSNHIDLENKIEKITESITEYNEYNESLKTNRNVVDGIQKLKASEEYIQYLKIQEEINSFHLVRLEIKNQIDSQFANISRPMNKYIYISSLDKPQKKLLENLINNPIEVLTEENKDGITQILDAVMKNVKSESISVKNIEKSLNHLSQTISLIDEFIDKINKCNQSKIDAENKLSIFNYSDLEKMELDLNKNQNNKNDMESELKSLDLETKSITVSMSESIKSIQFSLNQISAVNYVIELE
jgi:3-dehydroquinate dehydratase